MTDHELLGFIDDLSEELKKRRTYAAMSALKTLVGGWTTSHRMHGDDDSLCKFGCAAPDSMMHYRMCPELEGLLSEVGFELPSPAWDYRRRADRTGDFGEMVSKAIASHGLYHYARFARHLPSHDDLLDYLAEFCLDLRLLWPGVRGRQ